MQFVYYSFVIYNLLGFSSRSLGDKEHQKHKHKAC